MGSRDKDSGGVNVKHDKIRQANGGGKEKRKVGRE